MRRYGSEIFEQPRVALEGLLGKCQAVAVWCGGNTANPLIPSSIEQYPKVSVEAEARQRISILRLRAQKYGVTTCCPAHRPDTPSLRKLHGALCATSRIKDANLSGQKSRGRNGDV